MIALFGPEIIDIPMPIGLQNAFAKPINKQNSNICEFATNTCWNYPSCLFVDRIEFLAAVRNLSFLTGQKNGINTTWKCDLAQVRFGASAVARYKFDWGAK